VSFSIPVTNYRLKLADGIDPEEMATDLEASFVEHGMDTVALDAELEKEAAGGKTFFRMFIGFMSLGLLVGVAGLGVVSTRAVVERRQQIGVLRAIGYRRRMIQLSFLLEASFISLLGIVIGTVLGIVLGWQAYTDIKQDEGIDTIRFGIPWIQIGVILALTYVASLLATFLPARQASRVYPAEASVTSRGLRHPESLTTSRWIQESSQRRARHSGESRNPEGWRSAYTQSATFSRGRRRKSAEDLQTRGVAMTGRLRFRTPRRCCCALRPAARGSERATAEPGPAPVVGPAGYANPSRISDGPRPSPARLR
jgi:hypothetical protein